MYDRAKEKDQNLRTIIFLILLLLLFLVSSNNQGNHNSKRLSSRNEEFSVSISHHNAAVLNTGNCDLQKVKCTTDKASLSTFTRSILVYDHRAASSFIILQKSRLSVISLFTSRIFLHHFPEKDSDPPATC